MILVCMRVVRLTAISMSNGVSCVVCRLCMLYVFNKDSQEWKTRGKGNVKLMQHKENKQVRVVLREDKTLKLRMNHFVNPEVELKANMGSEKSWTWATTDYGDDEALEQTFAIKFKTEELAAEFKRKHDEARVLNGGSAAPTGKPKAAASTPVKTNAFASLKDATKWSCSVCDVENAKELTKCAACESPNPNAPAGSAASAPVASFGAGGFSFGVSGGDVGGGGFNFGAPAPAFGSPSAATPFSFSSPPAAAGSPSPFAFGGVASTPQKAAEEAKDPSSASKTPKKEDDEAAAAEEECTAEFAPVVKLQEVEVDSGEKNEDCMHTEYAMIVVNCL